MTYVWGHRGASGYAPENTLEAFKLADQMNADGIELDVQLTKDGQVVVLHDETIDRTSDHKGFVKDYTLQQLKTFNFNNHMENYEFCSIPTLEEVLQLVKPTRMCINIELKTGEFDYKGIEEKVITLVEKYQMQDRIIYSSFNHYSVMRIKAMNKDAYCGFLVCDKTIDQLEYVKSHGVEAIHPAAYFLLDNEFVYKAKQMGILINSWTLNEPQHIAGAVMAGINAVISNYPDRAVAIRNQLNKM